MEETDNELFLKKLKCKTFEAVVEMFYKYVNSGLESYKGKLDESRQLIGENDFKDQCITLKKELTTTYINIKLDYQFSDEVLDSKEELQKMLVSIAEIAWDWSNEETVGFIRTQIDYKVLIEKIKYLGTITNYNADPTEPLPAPTSTIVKEPYNAKIKVHFFEMVIDRRDDTVRKYRYKDNKEKFAAYALALEKHFGLIVKGGTLENNWNKGLNEVEQRQLRKLLMSFGYRDLALEVATMI